MGDDIRRNTLAVCAGVALLLSGLFAATLGGYIDWGRIGSDFSSGHAAAEDPDILWARAQAFQKDAQKDALQIPFAKAAARRVLILNPNHIPARKLLASYALPEKDWAEAETQCRNILRLDPNELVARLGLGAALKGENTPASRKEATEIYHKVWDDEKANGLQKDEAARNLRDLDPAWTAPPPAYLMETPNPSPSASPLIAPPPSGVPDVVR